MKDKATATATATAHGQTYHVEAFVEDYSSSKNKVSIFVNGDYIGERIYTFVQELNKCITSIDELVEYIADCYADNSIPQW